MVIPEHCVDPKTRRLLLTSIQLQPEFEDWLLPHVPAKGSITEVIEAVLPYTVAYSTLAQTPEDWLGENIQGVWLHWLDTLCFSNSDDAFAFRMRWT